MDMEGRREAERVLRAEFYSQARGEAGNELGKWVCGSLDEP